MLLVPALTLAGMVTLRLVESAAEARDIGVTADAVELARDVSAVIGALQAERMDAAMLVYQEDTGLADSETLVAAFEGHESATAEALQQLDATRSDLALDLDEESLTLMERADAPLERLATVREAVLDGSVAAVHLTVYNSAVARLSAVLDNAVDLAGTAELTRIVRTASLLSASTSTPSSCGSSCCPLRTASRGREAPDVHAPGRGPGGIAERVPPDRGADPPDAAVFKVGGIGAGEARPANGFESAVAGSRSDDDQVVDHTALMAAYDARHGATAALVGESLDEATSRANAISLAACSAWASRA